MANNKFIKHNYGTPSYSEYVIQPEPDKYKSISELTMTELRNMMERLSIEKDLEFIIREMKLNSGERDTYEHPFQIDTKTPINQLYHYGILGQKWGVRRFQNKDGSRTAEGKRRDASQKQYENLKSKKPNLKNLSKISNDDLRKLNERLQLEETYKRLTKNDMDKSQTWVQDALRNIGKQSLEKVGTGLLVGSAKVLIGHLAPEIVEAGFGKKKKDS